MSTLNPSVLGLDKAIPFSPLGILHLHASLLIGIPLLKADEFIEVCQHVNENTAVGFPLQEVLESELNAVLGLEEIDHLTDDVLEIKI